MNNLNSILLEGNMVGDPLIRTTPKGTSVCNFSVATNRYFKQDSAAAFEKETSFFDIEVWGRLAGSCSVQGRKGRSVRVVGRLRQDRWANPSGENRSRVVIVAEHVEFRPQSKAGDLPGLDADPGPDAETPELEICSA